MPCGSNLPKWAFTGILIDEEEGGLGLGHAEAGVVLEEIGRNLTPSPFLTTAVAGVEALNAGGKALRDKYFPGIIAGETVLSLAIDEGAKHRPGSDRHGCHSRRQRFQAGWQKAICGAGRISRCADRGGAHQWRRGR